MSVKKILINGITLEQATIFPLLLNCRYWLNHECSITFFGNSELKARIKQSGIFTSYKFVEFSDTKKITNKFQFIFEALRRNIAALPYIYKFRGEFDIVYTRSSVLDLIIFPYCLKNVDNKIKWLTVFDNIVPLNDPGNKFIRFLSWLFFQISLFFLKKSDMIFTISKDLKQFLIKKEFNEERIVITGNAVEADTIKQSVKDIRYSIYALFVGRINETKGIYDMLRVLEIVKREYPGFQLAIMGRGDETTEHKFQEKIQKLGLKSNIQFLGYKTGIEKFTIMKSSKCFWFLSLSESFGISLLEAVCCGLPAFAYDLPPYRHIYRNNEVIIVEKNNYLKVAERVIELFNKNDFKNIKGEELLDRYSWDAIAEVECNSF